MYSIPTMVEAKGYTRLRLDRNCWDWRTCSTRTARHAACKLRGKRRAGLGRARVRGRQTTSASSGRLATWLRSSSVPSVPARTPPLRPSPPNSGGQGLAAPQRAARCRDSPPPDCLRKLRQTGSVPLLAWLPFVTACAGALAGSAIAQPAAPPHCAGLSRPQLSGAPVKVRCRLPNQGRWSATEHNAGIMRSAKTALSASPHNLHYV